MQLVVDVVQVRPPGEDVTVYPVIELPPVDAGADQDTTDCAFALAVAETPVGAPGTVIGTTAAETLDAGPVPEEFVAVTVKV